MFVVALFAFYFVLLLYITYQITKRKIFNFNFWQVTAIFSFKVLLGCLYGYIFLKYYGGDDTWNFFNDSLGEKGKLIHHPDIFLKDFLPYASFGHEHSFGKAMGLYLRDLEYWTMIKLLAIFNIFSRDNYYIDVLFFDFAICWGPFLLFKLLLSGFPHKRKVLYICIFFIPSISFWLSGIRGEGLLFLFISLLLYYTNKCFLQKKLIYLFWITVAFAGFLVFRALFLLIFLPAFFSMVMSNNGKHKPIYYFTLTYLFCACIFFGSMLAFPGNNFSNRVIKQQAAFFALQGNTRFNLDTLKPSIGSFIKILPQAFANTFVRPFIWEVKGALQWIAAFEIISFWLLLMLLCIKPEKKTSQLLTHPLLLLFLFYGISQILLIGYIVPFPGAIVRYKTIPELFLVIIIAISINWNLNYNNK